MIFDSHIHINTKPEPERLLREMDSNNVERVALMSEGPLFLEKDVDKVRCSNRDRLTRLIEWCASSGGRLMPVYFLNPIEDDALEQVEHALEAGCAGFKIICETFPPEDGRAMPVYQRIADSGKAVLFHSGILWEGKNNGNYNRPCNWECMANVRNIRFALAHISWPWCEEAIAMYGKFICTPGHEKQKMYIDITPGTPDCRRLPVFRMLHDIGYPEIGKRLLFGTDQYTDNFSGRVIRDRAERDTALLEEAGFPAETVEDVLGNNAVDFWKN